MVRAFDGSHVVNVYFGDGLKVNATAQLGLMAIHVVGERSFLTIEHEPSLVPCLELLAHLEQVAATRVVVDGDQGLLGARINLIDELVSAVLDVLPKIEVVVSHW